MVDCTALERRHVRLGHRGFASLSFRQNPINPVELYLRGFLLLADFFLENSSLRLSVVFRLRRSSSVNARHFGKYFSNP